MPRSKWYLVCYDVRDDRRLRKVAKKLEGHGRRLQYSVFRLWLTGTELQRLRWELTELTAPEDDVLFLPVCGDCVRGICGTHATNESVAWPEAPPKYIII